MALLALGLAIVALTSTLWVTLAAVVVLGYGLPLTFIASMRMLKRRTPYGLTGRAFAAVETSWVPLRRSRWPAAPCW